MNTPLSKTTDPLLTESTTQLIEARKLWSDLGDIPINNNDEIDQDFLHFEKGTDRFEIWHWFEEEFDVSIATDLMGFDV